MKKILSFLLIVIASLSITGCEYSNELSLTENIKTSVYPIEYVTNYLYGSYASVKSIYPDGASYYDYEVTDKLIENYSSADLLIYNGASQEKKIAVKFLNNNENINIIDAMQGMNYKYSVEELWLDPSNLLMAASNIKNGLLKLAPNKITSEHINENYSKLKVDLSKLDVDFNTLLTNATYSKIVVSDDIFKYLNKYGVEVIVLNENNDNLTRAYSTVKALVKNKDIKYIYTIKGKKLSDELTKFIKDQGLTKIEIDPLNVISEEDRNNKEDYVSLMNEMLVNLKKELQK